MLSQGAEKVILWEFFFFRNYKTLFKKLFFCVKGSTFSYVSEFWR